MKFKVPDEKNNEEQKSLSYLAPSIWDKLPNFLKTTACTSIKKHCFYRMDNKETIFIATFNVNNVLTVIFNSVVINLIIITNIVTPVHFTSML